MSRPDGDTPPAANEGKLTDGGSFRGRLLGGTVANIVGQFVTLLTGFFLTPFILFHLGPTQYGLWVLVGSIVAYGTLLDFGIWGTVVKYVAEYRARDELAQARPLIVTALYLYVLLGLVAVVGSAIIAPYVPQWFNVPPETQDTARLLVVVTGVAVGVSIPTVTTFAILGGLHRFDLVNLLTIIGTLLTAAATVAVLLLGGGVIAVVAVDIPLSLLMQVPSIWLIKRLAPELRFGLRGARLSAVRTLVSFSSSLFVMQMATRVQTKTDEIVIGAFLPVSAITPYAIARRVSEMASLLSQQTSKVLVPLASQLDAQKDWLRLRNMYIVLSRLTLALSVLVGVTLVMLAGPFLTLWVGAAYAESAPLVAILTAAYLVDVSQMPASSVLQGAGRHRPLAIISVLAAVANLALSIVLVQRIGLVGVALGTLIPSAVVGLGLALPYAMRTLKVGLGEVLGRIWLPALLPAAPLVGMHLGLQQVLPPTSLLAFVVVGGAGALVYGVTYLAFGATKDERRIYRDVLTQGLALARKRPLRPAGGGYEHR
ncbi:MAG: lipopolysaccharide biosynthesis protein [Chloroflexota bacterium]